MRSRLLALAGALFLAGLLCLGQARHVDAYWQSRDSNYNQNIVSGGGSCGISSGYVGPGDCATFAHWWGSWAYNHANANAGPNTIPALVVYGPTTTTTCTVYLLGNGTGALDLASGTPCVAGTTTVTSFCTIANSSCDVNSYYDQAGSSNLSTSAGGKPTFSLATGLGQYIAASSDIVFNNSISSISQPFSISVVGEQTVACGSGCGLISSYSSGSNATFNWSGTSGNASLYAGTGVDVTASLSALHSMQAVFNGSSSLADIDGTVTSSLNPGTGALSTQIALGANPASGGTAFMSGFIGEAGIAASAFTSTQYNALCHNQYGRWGTAVLC